MVMETSILVSFCLIVFFFSTFLVHPCLPLWSCTHILSWACIPPGYPPSFLPTHPLPGVCSRLAPEEGLSPLKGHCAQGIVGQESQEWRSSDKTILLGVRDPGAQGRRRERDRDLTGHRFCPQGAVAGGNQLSHILAAMEAKNVSSPPTCPSVLWRPRHQSMFLLFPILGSRMPPSLASAYPKGKPLCDIGILSDL